MWTIASKLRLLADARAARAETGKTLVRQFVEIAALRRGFGRLYASEYYQFRLYDDRMFPGTAKHEFLGTRMEGPVSESVNAAAWDVVEEDKLVMYAILAGISLPIPRLQAIYHQGGRYFGSVPTLTSRADLAAFLRDKICYPFFAKPVHGSFGRGAFAVASHDKASDCLVFVTGATSRVDEFVASLDGVGGQRTHELGYLFQELLEPHPTLAPVCGRISSVRLLVLLHDDGPRVFRAVWKVPRPSNVTDNFHHGRAGNMLAWIDTTTGTVERVIGLVEGRLAEIPAHPDTGAPLVGLRLPQWDEVVSVGLRATVALPRLRFLHFDIAMTDRGPVIFEINVAGSFDLVQLVAPSGLYNTELRAFLAKHALTVPVRRFHQRAQRRFAGKPKPSS